MNYCPDHRGSYYNLAKLSTFAAPCGRWRCAVCGRWKARKVAARFARMRPNVLMTLSLARSAWATPENHAELQRKWRMMSRWMQRHRLVEAFGWVPEEGAPRADCLCHPSSDRQRALALHCEDCRAAAAARQGCECDANGGRQLHRHYLLRVSPRRGFRPGWLPWKRLQAVAKRLGLGTLDFRPINDAFGAAQYVSKYLFKATGAPVSGSRRRFTLTEAPPEPSHEWKWNPARVATVAVELLGAIAVDWDAMRWDAVASP